MSITNELRALKDVQIAAEAWAAERRGHRDSALLQILEDRLFRSLTNAREAERREDWRWDRRA